MVSWEEVLSDCESWENLPSWCCFVVCLFVWFEYVFVCVEEKDEDETKWALCSRVLKEGAVVCSDALTPRWGEKTSRYTLHATILLSPMSRPSFPWNTTAVVKLLPSSELALADTESRSRLATMKGT